MNAIERLRRDHGILRAKLGVIETALRMGPQTWFVLREVCHTLAGQLADHICREEAVVAACRHALSDEMVAHLTVEHRDEPEHLRTINRLFLRAPAASLAEIAPVLTEVIRGLRRHMAEEETELFPIMERMLAAQEQEPPRAATPRNRLDEIMTVNRVLREHPETRRVFDRLFVNVPLEGCDCLDEVAWRHGMEAREMLEKLERVLGTSAKDSAPASDDACQCDSPLPVR